MRSRAGHFVATIFFGSIALALCVTGSADQKSGALSAEQIERVHSRLTQVSTQLESIAEMLSTTTGDIRLVGTHIMGAGTGNYLGYPPFFLRVKVCSADMVVVGTPVSGVSHMTAEKHFLYTDWQFRVIEIFKNNSKAPVPAEASITVIRPGGQLKIGERTVYAAENNFKDFYPGEQDLLFLEFIPETGAYKATAEDSFKFSGENTIRFTRDSVYPDLEAMDKKHLLKATNDAIAAMPAHSNCAGTAQK
jgi:hypothetical protein